MIPPRILAAAGVVIAAFLAGWWINGDRWEARVSKQAQQQAESDRQAVVKLADIQRQRQAEQDALTARLQVAADQHLAALAASQHETASLRDRLRVGDVRLRIAATCLGAVPNSPASAASASLDTGTGAELDAAAGSAYFALRDGIDRAGAQLAACQAELKLRAP